jgi:hypothetical protein
VSSKIAGGLDSLLNGRAFGGWTPALPGVEQALIIHGSMLVATFVQKWQAEFL